MFLVRGMGLETLFTKFRNKNYGDSGLQVQTLVELDTRGERSLGRLAAGEQPIGWTTDGRGLLLADLGLVPLRIMRLDVASGARTVHSLLAPPDPAGVAIVDRVRVDDTGMLVAYSFIRGTMSDLLLADPVK